MHPDEVLVGRQDLTRFVGQLFQARGLSAKDADDQAAILVRTDVRGIFSHGTRMAPKYLDAIRDGHIKANPQPKTERETAAMALIDAGRGIGHLAARDAMNVAIEKARQVGVAMVNVKGSHHCGAVSMYTLQAQEAGMIGFATTNTGGASVAPYGGRTGALANNPVSWAFPSEGDFPIVIDMAAGVSAWQRIETMRIYGETLPDDWCWDKEGNPTTDPALGFTMRAAGGTRGSGLALAAALLTGALSGGDFPSRRERANPVADSEHTFLAVSVEHFVDMPHFYGEVAESIRALHATKPEQGFTEVLAPGELEWRRETAWSKDGLPLHKDHLQILAAAADPLNVPVVW